MVANFIEGDFRRIKRLPDAICDLPNLEMLEIGKVWGSPDLYCKLVELPAKIGNLKKLKYLYLQYQSIETLPNDICRLENLKELKLGGNNLKTLPDDIGNLSQLETLTMWKNKIDRLPESITNLINLKELNLSFNPIEHKVLSQDIVEWMKELQKNGCNIEFNNDYIQFHGDWYERTF